MSRLRAVLRWRVQQACDATGRDIATLARGGPIAAGLSAEGYDGGYRDALRDVLALLDGVPPSTRNATRWTT